MNEHELTRARVFAQTHRDEALELLRTLARIPAPSHHEERRASFVRSWLRENGLTDEQIQKELEDAVDKVNEKLVNYKKIKKTVLRKEEFEKNTSRKIKRY